MDNDIKEIIDLINNSKVKESLLAWNIFIDKYVPSESLLDFYFADISTQIRYYPQVAIESLEHFLKNKSKFKKTQQYADGAIKINNVLNKDGKIKDEQL